MAGVEVRGRRPRGAYIPGGLSAVIMMKIVQHRLPAEIEEMSRNPRFDARDVRELRGVLADIRAAALESLDWTAQVPAAAAALVPERPRDPDSVVMDTAEVTDTAEAAKRLDRSERWVRQLCGSGRLLAAKVGGRWLIARAVFEAERSAAA